MNYKTIKENQLKCICGGGKAMNTLTGGLSGATTGVKLCTVAGPWAMAGCGIIGGVIGGVIGYNAP
ncbi:Blp family class II bacteriocin [Enterococcus faecalis]|nr:bacteriocin [Enterococcus faecalis]MDY4070641.1 Blp family class II bacteriocin [Enterococcus gallinarum]OOG24511.1 bacteriocin [Enterococcus casseliflavus]EHQ8825904.1 Blp family class II bacteriocin [Enterococcus faecalis]EIM5405686.1 Blp family class II bacteriocin [Enterococcus faecalis]